MYGASIPAWRAVLPADPDAVFCGLGAAAVAEPLPAADTMTWGRGALPAGRNSPDANVSPPDKSAALAAAVLGLLRCRRGPKTPVVSHLPEVLVEQGSRFGRTHADRASILLAETLLLDQEPSVGTGPRGRRGRPPSICTDGK